MILKIHTPKNGWQFYDNLYQLHHFDRPYPNSDETPNMELIVVDEDTPEIPTDQSVMGTRVSAQNKEGREFIFWFNTWAYILNDNGKTVEKIVPLHQRKTQ